MPLQISKTNARVLERLDIQLPPATLTIVEGLDSAAPLDLTLSIADHGSLHVSVTLDDLSELYLEIMEYISRVQQGRKD